jgi:serine/threonine protein kinase
MLGNESIAVDSVALQRACDELSRRLRVGESCRSEEFLSAEPSISSDTDAVLELLYTEFLVREQLGQQPQAQEWYDRFPQWTQELKQLFDVHELMDEVDRPLAGLSGTHGGGSTLGTNGRQGGVEAPGQVVGGYEILEEVGRGGMGVVYQARQRGLGRNVALKMILPPHGPRERARFRTEAEATAKLSHPNIVQIYEVGQDGDCPFLSMEFVRGESLDKRLAKELMASRAAAELVETLARAVAYAHAQGIIHRDLKPANVLIADCGLRIADSGQRQSAIRDQKSAIPKITDFGLARQLVPRDSADAPSDAPLSGAILGTPNYMAPEQCATSGCVGPRADVYALGAILYEALTGRPPFRGQSALDVLELVRSQDPVPPSRLVPKVPRDLETICLKCLAKQPAQRYDSATSLAEDLRRFLAGEPIIARPVGLVERAGRWCRRNPAIAALAGGIALLLVGGIATSTSLAVWALTEKDHAAEHAYRADENAKQAGELAQQERQARELAEYRFEQAEKAVDHYLDAIEANEHLKESDFFELRKGLVASAVPFYEDFVRQKPGDRELEMKRGRVYGRLGFLRRQIGEVEQAAADFKQMRAIFERLGSTDPAVRSELAKSHVGLATVLDELGQKGQAEVECRKSFDLYHGLAAEFPGDVTYQRNLANCRWRLAMVLKGLGKRAEAEAELRAALATTGELATEFPRNSDYQEDLAGLHTILATTLAKGAEEEEEGHYREAIRLREKLVEEFPDRAEHRLGLANSHANFGTFFNDLRKREIALVEYQKALVLRKQLAEDFPSIPAYRQHLAQSHRSVAYTLLALRKPADAESDLRQALVLMERLAADFPAIPLYKSELASVHHNLGMLLEDLGKTQEAEPEYRQALAMVVQLAKEVPATPLIRRSLADRYYSLGLVLARLGRFAEAEPEFVQSIALYKELAAEYPDDHGVLKWLAVAQKNLGALLLAMKRPAEAREVHRETMELRIRLLEEFPDDPGYLRGSAATMNHLADSLRNDGEIDEARRLYAEAVELELKAQSLEPFYATYTESLKALRDHYHDLASTALLQKDHAAAADAADKMCKVRPDNAADAQSAARLVGRCVALAEQDLQLSEDDRRALAQSYADESMRHLHEAVRRGYKNDAALRTLTDLAPLRKRADFQQLIQELHALAGELFRQAVQLRKEGKADEARQRYEQAAEQHLKSLQAEPTNSDYRRYLRDDYHGVGDMALIQKDHEGAADAANKLAELHPNNALDAELAARFFGRCVRLAEQDMELSEDERVALAQIYADRAMEHLREAVRRGFNNGAVIKSREALQPLLDRSDFQELVRELEARQ